MKTKDELLKNKETAQVLTDETFGKFTEGVTYMYNNFIFYVSGKVKREGASPLYEIDLLDMSKADNKETAYSLPIGDIKKKVGCTYKKVYASQSTGKIVVLSEEDITRTVEKKAEHMSSAYTKFHDLLAEFIPMDKMIELEILYTEKLRTMYSEEAEKHYKQKAIEAKTKKEEADKKQAVKKLDMSKLTPEQLAAILQIVNGTK